MAEQILHPGTACPAGPRYDKQHSFVSLTRGAFTVGTRCQKCGLTIVYPEAPAPQAIDWEAEFARLEGSHG